MEQTAEEALRLALRHLDRVLSAWDEPTDWSDLSIYGFYCLEACVVAAGLHLDGRAPRGHRAKERKARQLNAEHGLPDIGDLLVDLNDMRKYEAYGDTEYPTDLGAEEIARAIEHYVDAVKDLRSR